MTFKPMTYLVSFTLFVMLFMGLGGYVGYNKIADHLLAQGFLEATPMDVQVLPDQRGQVLHWEGKVPLQGGLSASIMASNRPLPVSIRYSGAGPSTAQPSTAADAIPLAPNERAEDLRIDKTGRYLYARVFATSDIKAKETTWLYKYDLQRRRLLRRTSVSPIMLPAPFRP